MGNTIYYPNDVFPIYWPEYYPPSYTQEHYYYGCNHKDNNNEILLEIIKLLIELIRDKK